MSCSIACADKQPADEPEQDAEQVKADVAKAEPEVDAPAPFASAVLFEGPMQHIQVTAIENRLVFTEGNISGPYDLYILRDDLIVHIATIEHEPYRLTVDDDGVYWLRHETDEAPTVWGVLYHDLNWSKPKQLAKLSGLGEFELATTKQYIYATIDRQLVQIPKPGGKPKRLGVDVRELQTEDDWLYWRAVENGEYRILAANEATPKQPKIVASSSVKISAFAVLGGQVYWVRSPDDTDTCTLMRSTRDGTSEELLTTKLWVNHVAFGDGFVLLRGEQGIGLLRHGTNEVETIYDGESLFRNPPVVFGATPVWVTKEAMMTDASVWFMRLREGKPLTHQQLTQLPRL